ncbi:MetQ/NlpA family ABC transporter substrate-binding protein [Tessaracoccus massiliensis]|uniref:MetQ/NlpA family ABC transporter substrate-binding protein n=1 Tax=Tessaracoccus massiliensis TaxID=1522311 RepID=UPI00058E051B|nr:MetQ/NlpA family ABC transporter substrate-binding protein [Tessaracoccus massiliensis]
MNTRTWIAGIAAAGLLLTGCGATSDSEGADGEKTEITYGKAQGPYTVLFEDAIIPIMEADGYTFEKVDMSDLVQNNIALDEGSIDVNVEQHSAYAEAFNESNDADITLIGPIPTVPAGLFSGRHDSLEDVSEGMTVGLPNDHANTSRAYALLQKAGWITLDPDADLATVTQADVIENPMNLEFIELVNTTVAATVEDFDFAVITGSIVYNAGIDPSTALLQEDILDHLVLGVAVTAENEDAAWAQDIVAAYQSDEFKEYLEANNDGLWWVPEELR